ncbi:MAG: hypothetical protein AB2A00_16155 [Myxococcota bacterium]
MNLARKLLIPLLALLALHVACRKEVATPPDVMSHLPASTTVVLFGPSLLEATAGVKGLAGALQGPGSAAPGSNVPDVARDISARLGFDPFTAEGLKAAGLDPAGAFALGLEPGGQGVMVLTVVDAKVALDTMARLAAQMERADKVKQEQVPGGLVTTYARPFGSREIPVMSAAVVGTHLLVSADKEGAARLARVLALKPGESLHGHPLVKSAETLVPGVPVRFLVETRGASGAGNEGKIAERTLKHVLGGVALGAQGLKITLHAALQDERRDAVMAALFPSGKAPAVLSLVDEDALVLGQGHLVAERVKEIASSVDPGSVDRLKGQARQVGLEVDEDLLALTDGHLAGAMYLTDAAELMAMVSGKANPRRELLRMLPFVVVMRPKAGTTADALVLAITERMKKRGMTVGPAPDDKTVTVGELPGGEVWRSYRIAVVGEQVLVGGGAAQRFHSALKRLRSGEKANVVLAADGSEALGNGGSALVIRMPAATQRVDEVLAGNLGTDADALMIRNFLQKARGMMGRVGEVVLEMHPVDGAVRGVISVPLKTGTP